MEFQWGRHARGDYFKRVLQLHCCTRSLLLLTLSAIPAAKAIAFASTALHSFEPRDVSNTSEEACSVSYTCLSEKITLPKRQQRCFHNVHGAGGVMGSEATGFPENNLHAAVGNKKCFANVFLLITFPSRAGEAAFCYETLVL